MFTSNDLAERPPGNWAADPLRAPSLIEGDSLLHDVCGRILDKTDFRSHYFRVVLARFGGAFLLVKHGGGQERIQIDYNSIRAARLLAQFNSADELYLMLHMLYSVHSKAYRAAAENTASIYRQAFASGKLKKRKQRGVDGVKVWLES